MGRRKGNPSFDMTKQRQDLEYTERQHAILNDDIPLSSVTLNELTRLITKAKARDDAYCLVIAQIMYDAKSHAFNYKPNLTVDKAKEILQSLTPWKIIWP